MAIVTTDSKHYSDIANTIRKKTGEATTYKPEEMPTGVDEVYDAGKQAEYDRFWDTFQQNGKRGRYEMAFSGEGWTEETFRPKYDIVLSAQYNASMFRSASKLTGLYEATIGRGLKFDTSKATALGQMFTYCERLTRIPPIDYSGGIDTTSMYQGCTSLVTIDKFTIREDTNFYNNTFMNCYELQNLIIEGTIGTNGFNVSWSTKLTHDSLMSIINALQDKTSVGGTWTVTLGTDNLAKLTDAEKAIATQKGWTLA